MSDNTLRASIQDAMKTALREKDKARLATIRLILADIKRIEVDERIELDDTRTLAVLDKMRKQRRDSIEQYESAGRQELADIEAQEITVIESFMPSPLSDAEIDDIVTQTIADTGAASIKDMGRVMAALKPQLQGRADMGQVSARIKQQLS